MELYIYMFTYINMRFLCVFCSAERVVSDMAKDCESCAAHFATPLPDHQLVVRVGAAPGQPHQVYVPDTVLACQLRGGGFSSCRLWVALACMSSCAGL